MRVNGFIVVKLGSITQGRKSIKVVSLTQLQIKSTDHWMGYNKLDRKHLDMIL